MSTCQQGDMDERGKKSGELTAGRILPALTQEIRVDDGARRRSAREEPSRPGPAPRRMVRGSEMGANFKSPQWKTRHPETLIVRPCTFGLSMLTKC